MHLITLGHGDSHEAGEGVHHFCQIHNLPLHSTFVGRDHQAVAHTHTHTHTAIFSPSNPYALKVALLSCLALDWRQGQQRSSGQHLSAPSCLVLLHILDFTTYVCVLHFRPWLGDCVSPCKPCSTNNPAFSRFVRGCSYYKTTPLV